MELRKEISSEVRPRALAAWLRSGLWRAKQNKEFCRISIKIVYGKSRLRRDAKLVQTRSVTKTSALGLWTIPAVFAHLAGADGQ
jgi:hypothetical protein